MITENLVLEDIAKLIINGNSSGYYPYWVLSFEENYRSWHIKDSNIRLIANEVLSNCIEGTVTEEIDDKFIQITWRIEIAEINE